MLQLVIEQRPSYNNNASITRSATVSLLKRVYYRFFALAYSSSGRCVDLAMVNSSWTQTHIVDLWGYGTNIVKVFPPCNTTEFRQIPLAGRRQRVVLSVGQFRPEKDHMLQLKYVA